MSDLFLSYKHDDWQWAEAVKRQVEEWGYTVWWDRDMRAGENIVLRVTQELERSKATIVMLTSRAVVAVDEQNPESWVLAEAAWTRKKKPLLPILVPPLESENLPPPFNNLKVLKWADAEDIHVELHKYGVTPSNEAVEKPVFRENVFTTGIPTYTEVDRSRTRAFEEIRSNLRMKGRIVRFFGPTQSGKTVMARRALEGFMPIELAGTKLDSRQSFYDAIAANHAPDIPQDGRIARVTKFIQESKRPIIIDDFHFIKTDVQQAIIEDAKDLIERDVNVVLISIPDCAADFIERRAEFRNRSVAIRSPNWTEPQLERIPGAGFRRLKILMHPKVIEELIEQSHGNPLLMQNFCYKICELRRITKTLEKPTAIQITRAELTNIFKAVGAERKYDLIPLLMGATGDDDSVGQRVRWPGGETRGSTQRKLSLAALILVVLNREAGFRQFKAKTIAKYAEPRIFPLDRLHVTEKTVLAAGRDLIRRLELAKVADTVIGSIDDKFFIQHADFMVHLHWTLAPALTGIVPQLQNLTKDYTASEIEQAVS